MKVVLTLCVLKVICTVLAAPINEEEENSELPTELMTEIQEDPRDKRSNYGNPHVSPCAAAYSSLSNTPSNQLPTYQLNIAPVQQYTNPYTYGYNSNYLRYSLVDPNESELQSFSDINHFTAENWPVGYERRNMRNYPGEPRMAILNSPAVPGQSTQSFAVFPYTNPGGVSQPLLFSCTPSVVQGQMVYSQPQFYSEYHAPDPYKTIELPHMFEAQDHMSAQSEYSSLPQKPNVETNPQ